MAIRIPYQVARQIADHALADAPAEACGLLAGDSATLLRAIPIANAALDHGERYQLDANEQLTALKAIDADGLQWIGVYHSHPRSAPIPSSADIAGSLDPKLLHLIVSLERRKPALKLWRIDGRAVEPLDLVFDTDTAEGTVQLSFRQRAAIAVAGIASLLLLVAVSVSLLPPAPPITLVP